MAVSSWIWRRLKSSKLYERPNLRTSPIRLSRCVTQCATAYAQCDNRRVVAHCGAARRSNDRFGVGSRHRPVSLKRARTTSAPPTLRASHHALLLSSRCIDRELHRKIDARRCRRQRLHRGQRPQHDITPLGPFARAEPGNIATPN